MLEMFTDTNPMRDAQSRLPADGMGTGSREQARLDKEAQARWLSQKTKRVCDLADQLLTGESIIIDGHSFSYRQVMSELQHHSLYDGAMNAFRLGNTDPLEDLMLRAARRSAAFMLRIDPDELGLGA